MADASEERVRTTVATFFPLHAQVAAPAGAQVALQAQAQAGQAEVQHGQGLARAFLTPVGVDNKDRIAPSRPGRVSR